MNFRRSSAVVYNNENMTVRKEMMNSTLAQINTFNLSKRNYLEHGRTSLSGLRTLNFARKSVPMSKHED